MRSIVLVDYIDQDLDQVINLKYRPRPSAKLRKGAVLKLREQGLLSLNSVTAGGGVTPFGKAACAKLP